MRSPFYFIVSPCGEVRYDAVKKYDNKELIISTSKEDHTTSNRFASVISTPLNYKGPIEPGDILLVHHNVFKYYYDMKGRERSGRSFFRDNLFFIDQDQFYMYKKMIKWYTHDDYCFVSPSRSKKSIYHKTQKNEDLVGTVVHSNKNLYTLGVKEGDEVMFTPDSEYEFIVGGEKMYRMKTKNICAIL